MEASKTTTVYFPGLNGLRFLAALAVIITHVELIKGVLGYDNLWHNTLFFHLGSLGVYFFFVLSGFLITYLLLAEKQQTGRVSIRKFYIRRVLRIWPLYYLVLLLGFFLLPGFDAIDIPYLERDFHDHFGANLLLYIFILPNLAFSFFRAVPHIGQAWSIGVEEQFYLAWPWLIARSKNILRTLLYTLFVVVAIKALVLLMGIWFSNATWYLALKTFLAMSKFECMAIGALGAYVLFMRQEFTLRIFFHKITFLLSLAAIPMLLYCVPVPFQDGVHLPFSLAFLCIILNVAANNRFQWLLENGPMSYLGKISYGIYMYHLMIIPVCIWFLGKILNVHEDGRFTVMVYLSSISTTIAVSAFSYSLIESRFIRMKHAFTKVKSGIPENHDSDKQ